MNAKGKKKRVRNSGEGDAVDEGCGATKRTEKGETDREEGKERRRTRETESERVRGTEEAKGG